MFSNINLVHTSRNSCLEKDLGGEKTNEKGKVQSTHLYKLQSLIMCKNFNFLKESESVREETQTIPLPKI